MQPELEHLKHLILIGIIAVPFIGAAIMVAFAYFTLRAGRR